MKEIAKRIVKEIIKAIGIFVLVCFGVFLLIRVLVPHPGSSSPVISMDDHLEIYQDFLQHSLGDFELLEYGVRSRDSGMVRYRWWRVQFIDENGEDQVFTFDTRPMAWQVAEAAASQVDEEELATLAIDLRENHLENSEHLSEITLSVRFQNGLRVHEGDWEQLLDPNDGLQLSTLITAQSLMEEWGFYPTVEIRSRSESSDAIEEMEMFMRDLADYFNQDIILVTFTRTRWLLSDRDPEHFTYDRQTDSFRSTN